MLFRSRCRVAIAEGRLGAAIDAGREAIRLCRQPPDRRETAALLGNLFLRIGAPAQAGDMAAAIAGWPLHVPDRLPLASIVLAAALDRDTGSARAALHEALLDPHADRVLHEDIDSAHVLLGQLALAAGDAAGARAAVARVGYSVAHEGDALAVRLAAGRVDGRADEAAFAAATALVDSGRLPALVQLDLLRALADETARLGRHRRWTPGWRERMAAQAQSLADALQAAPPLQAGFIRRHRDLLT